MRKIGIDKAIKVALMDYELLHEAYLKTHSRNEYLQTIKLVKK